MQEPTKSWRQCPTRPEGAEVLIEHRISGGTCQDRQRKHFHKCFTCIHQNAKQEQRTGSLPPMKGQRVAEIAVAATGASKPEVAAPTSTERPASPSARQAG